jgi:exopolysaccharide biosynthesis protein
MQPRRAWIVGITVSAIAGLIILTNCSQSTSILVKEATLNYRVIEQPDSIVHLLTIPNNRNYALLPYVSENLATVAQMSSKIEREIAVLNGGFFDPLNQKTTSYVVIDGQEVASPEQNERLMGNPDLTTYLPAILNRSEFRVYQCEGGQRRYDIVPHQAPLPPTCQRQHAIAGGPQLLPVDTSQPEAFIDYAEGTLRRDALGHSQPNARTAIGLTADGIVLWVMVAQKPTASGRSGMTLPALAAFMKDLGAQKVLNLDGGTSSSLYYGGQTINGKLSPSGDPSSRAVKSGLAIIQVNEPF